MKNKAWGWWTAWFNLIGQVAIVAGINFSAALFLNITIVTPLLAHVGITYDNTTGIGPWISPISHTPVITGQLFTMGVLMLIQLALNIAGVSLVALLNQVSVWWHIGIVALVVVLLLLVGKPNESGLTYFQIQPLDQAGSWDNNLGFAHFQYGAAVTYPLFLAFLFSLLQAQWTYTGYDASAHVAEETIGARLSSAWGIFISVAVSAIAGFLFLLALTLHLPNLTTLFPATLPSDLTPVSQYYFGGQAAVISILNYNLGSVGDLLSAGIAIAMSFCGLASIAAAGRMLFAFSRDNGVPASGWLKRVSHRYRTPANAMIGIVSFAWIFNAAANFLGGPTAVAIVTGISTIFLYAAYGVPIWLGLTTSEWRKERVWSLGRLSKPIAVLSVLWILFLMVLFSWPTSGNIALPFIVAAAVFLLVYYFAWARRRFEGPRVMGGERQLEEIEREFEHAAGALHGGATT